MKTTAQRQTCGVLAATLVAAATFAMPVSAHHSFSVFDAEVTKVFTGVVTRVNPDANHLQIFFAPMNARAQERASAARTASLSSGPSKWRGSAQSARDGISVSTFPPGTIFSVALHPLRSGDPAGSRERTAMFKCPEKTPPAPGKHCDSVEGSTVFGEGALPTPTE